MPKKHQCYRTKNNLKITFTPQPLFKTNCTLAPAQSILMETALIQAIAAQKPYFVCKNTGEELLLVPLKGDVVDFNQFLTMNEVGAFIWEAIDPTCSFDDLVNRVYEEYDVEKNVIAADVRQFLEKLATFVTTA